MIKRTTISINFYKVMSHKRGIMYKIIQRNDIIAPILLITLNNTTPRELYIYNDIYPQLVNTKKYLKPELPSMSLRFWGAICYKGALLQPWCGAFLQRSEIFSSSAAPMALTSYFLCCLCCAINQYFFISFVH